MSESSCVAIDVATHLRFNVGVAVIDVPWTGLLKWLSSFADTHKVGRLNRKGNQITFLLGFLVVESASFGQVVRFDLVVWREGWRCELQ